MRVLHLTLTKNYFDMIYAGIKPEEYRAIKMYWVTRFIKRKIGVHPEDYYPDELMSELRKFGYLEVNAKCFDGDIKKWDVIKFTNGYGKNAPSFLIEFKGIEVGVGNTEWGAPKENVFIIKLGKIIK